jgi:hypothetical protein
MTRQQIGLCLNVICPLSNSHRIGLDRTPRID